MNKKISKELEEEIIKLYKSGKTSYECAEELDISQSTVLRTLKRNDLKSRGCLGGKRIFSVNEDYFEEIDTPLKSYFLGWMYSDGYIMNKGFGLTVSYKDGYILDYLKSDIEYKGRLYIKKENKSSKPCISLIISCKKLRKDIISKGVIPKKSLILKFPEFIDNKLTPHFIRGLFDGDGCIYVTKNERKIIVSYIGTEDMCKGVQKVLEINDIKSSGIYKRGNISTLVYASKNSVEKLYTYIYKDQNMCLMRKKEKLEKFFDNEKIKYL